MSDLLDEAEREAVHELRLRLVLDGAAPPELRAAARARLTAGEPDIEALDVDDLFALEGILRRAMGKPPAPPRPPPCAPPPVTAIAAPCPRCASLNLGAEKLDELFARLRTALAEEPDDDDDEPQDAELLDEGETADGEDEET